MRANRGQGPLLQGETVPCGSRASSLLRVFMPTPPRAPIAPYRRPSETGAEEVMRHGCTLGGGPPLRGVREGSPALSGPYVRGSDLWLLSGV